MHSSGKQSESVFAVLRQILNFAAEVARRQIEIIAGENLIQILVMHSNGTKVLVNHGLVI